LETTGGLNAYASRFTQGATIVPRNFFFVEVSQSLPAGTNVRDRVVSIRTTEASDREAKKQWKGQLLKGRTEGALFFRTAISRNIIPFALVGPLLVVLPVVTKADERGKEHFEMLNSDGLMEHGYPYGSDWFRKAETSWDKLKTDKNKGTGISLASYLDWQSKLSDQDPGARYLVLYTSSATDASAVVIDRRSFDHPFIVDHKAYWCACPSKAEAHYVCAYINSGYANGKIKDFQSRGLFGPRDIHKLIVKLPFPKYQRGNVRHEELSALGRKCAGLAGHFVSAVNVEDLHARALGSVRARLKVHIGPDLQRIDGIVATLSGGKTTPERKPKKRSRRASGTGQLFD
jgi:hypothetical protein